MRVFGSKRRRCVGKEWIAGGLIQPRTGRVGVLIGPQPCVETLRCSCAAWILDRQKRSRMLRAGNHLHTNFRSSLAMLRLVELSFNW